MIYCYTSLTDGFDNVRPPCVPVDHNVRYVCFTNIPNLPRVYPWEYRPIYNAGAPARTARVAKILPHLMLPDDAEYSIYHDGNFQLREDPNKLIDILDRDHQWAAHKHPCRDCIYDEARIVMRDCPLVDSGSVERQIAGYRVAGHPEHAGLWANGFIIRRHTPEVAALNEEWWRLFAAGSERDQLSFPVARRNLNMPVRTIDADVFSSPYIKGNPHAAFKNQGDNPDFWKERSGVRRRLGRLAELAGADARVNFQAY